MTQIVWETNVADILSVNDMHIGKGGSSIMC